MITTGKIYISPVLYFSTLFTVYFSFLLFYDK